MSNLLIEVLGTDVNSGDRIKDTVEMTPKEFMSHAKQIVNSLVRTGIVHEIEDPDNPFNGIIVDAVVIQNDDHPVFDDDDDDEWEDE